MFMKKLLPLLLVFLSIQLNAQTVDTLMVRYHTDGTTDTLSISKIEEKQKKIHFEKYILEKDKALVKKNEEISKKNLQNKYIYFIGGIVILILLSLFLFGGDNPKK